MTRTRRMWLGSPLLLACAVMLAAGCSMFGAGKEEKARQLAPSMKLGAGLEGSLHCDRRRCKEWYKIHIKKRSPILIEVDGPGDQSLPDFGITLQSAGLEVIGDDRVDFRRPRKIDKSLAPGLYYLSVWSRGDNKDWVSYKASAKVKTRRRASGQRRSPTKKTAPAPAPAPAVVMIDTEVLEVERSGGEPDAVLLEAGAAYGIKPGSRGRLVEAGRVIGELEVVDVYAEGSRARIVDGLSAPITLDTRAELEKPAGADQ